MGAHHQHGHGGHVHGAERTAGRLIGAAAINVSFAAVQVVVGLALASVAVLADAAHQVVDAIGLVTALVAVLLARRPASDDMSFGWGKVDALGGLASAALLFASVGWIVWESVDRLRDPSDVSGSGVIIIGIIAILINGGSVMLLGSHADNLSLRAARLHLLTDLAGSAIVVVTGIILAGGGWNGFDAIASLVLSAMVIQATWRLIRAAMDELLDRSPSTVTPEAIRAALGDVHGVLSVHHVHARPLGGGMVSVTAHVVVDGEQSLHDAQEHIGAVSTRLAERLGVAHTTLQLECHDCDDPEH